jgi:opacity protein-like surface antigen
LLVGLDLQLYIDRYKDDSSDDIYTYTQVVIGPFVRYYIGSGKIKPYGHFAIGGGSAIDKYDPDGGSTDTEKSGILAMQFGGGAAFFINDNVALDLGLLYQRYRTKPKEDNDVNYRDISQQFGLNVGVTALF